MTRYDFTGAADFLNNDVPLDSLFDEVYTAWGHTFSKRLTKAKKEEVYGALNMCLDFLATIQIKKGGRK